MVLRGKLIIFSAPSGSGKTTIVKHLLSKGLNLGFSISATCRQARKGEQQGVDYFFLSPEEFRNKIDLGEFLEWEEVYPGTYYGTLKSEVERLRDKGIHVLFDVDVAGGCNIKAYYGEEALSVFIRPPSFGVLEERLRKRSTDSDEVIATRLAKASYEMSFESRFDVVIINDQLEKALEESERIVTRFIEAP